MSAVFIFEMKDKVLFPRNGWPYGYDFWRVFRDLCEAYSKTISKNTSQYFLRYSKTMY